MIAKPLNQVKVRDLAALVGNAREGKTIEFKREMPARTQEEDHVSLGVSSLANTAGSDLIVDFLEAVDGLVQSVLGLKSRTSTSCAT